MKHTFKSKQVENFIESTLFFKRIESIRKNTCTFCGNHVIIENMSQIDLDEYSISGLCSECQSNIFKE